LVIWDDNSSDSTPEVIRSLIEEGLPIELNLIPNSGKIERNLVHADIVNSRCVDVLDRYNADWVLCLDVDEFLCCENGINPRTELEKLDDDKEYRMPWRTSVYCQEPSDSTIFLPNFFEEYRDPEIESFTKTLISKYLMRQYDAFFNPGWHELIIKDEEVRAKVSIIEHPTLCVAHFPIRSVAHAMVKVICMQLRFYALRKGVNKPFQYESMYNEIKSTGIPTFEQVRRFSLEYALLPNQLGKTIETYNQFRGALYANFLPNDIKLRYTDYKKCNYIGAIISYFEILLMKMQKSYIKQKILFGAGFYGEKALEYYGEDLVYAFADTKKYGTAFMGKQVVNPSELGTLCANYDIVICIYDYENVAKYLYKMGIDNFDVFVK